MIPRNQLGDGEVISLTRLSYPAAASRSSGLQSACELRQPFRRRASRGEAYQGHSLKTIPTAGIAAAGPVDREITLTLKTLISRRFRDKVICSAEASRSGSS
jgi:hypothetical protein